jgi:Domain of unknown function (DUF1707).
VAQETEGGRKPEIRIGDAERRAVDARLQKAQAEGRITLVEYDERAARCWAARTQAELDELTADLPPEPVSASEEPVKVEPERTEGQQGVLARIGNAIGSVAVLALLGYAAVTILGADDGAAIFGNLSVSVPPGQQRVEVGMLFGNAEVVVPDGVRARTTGTVLFGNRVCEEACSPSAANAPTVVVDATGAFGSVRVLTESEKRAHAADRAGARSDRDDD